MPTTDQDLRALTFLARRLRDETHGCNRWDEAGTFAVLKAELAGLHLLTATQRVIAHAVDPAAKTPGAIRRPFTPEPPTPVPTRQPFDPATTCATCNRTEAKCRELAARPDDGHPFVPVARRRATPAAPRPDTTRNPKEKP